MSEIVKKPSRLKGMKIRDEFLCPITFEVLKDPVVASDGHTYEKGAIEKWLRHNNKSPRSGEILTSKHLVPNVNMKKLIQDLIHEGGSGLYCLDTADKARLFDVYPEKIVVLKCLGPPESDWNGQSFQITPSGCMGGRKVLDPPPGCEIVAFRDSTVSRRHFEVMCDAATKKYALRDLGSAGGTFIRIPYKERRELHPGMMLLIGKHQFTVSSIDHATNSNAAACTLPSPSGAHDANNRSMLDFVDEAEDLLQQLSSSVSTGQIDNGAKGAGDAMPAVPEFDHRLRALNSKMTRLRMMSGNQNRSLVPPDSEIITYDSGEEEEGDDGSDAKPARKRQNVNSSRVVEEAESMHMDVENVDPALAGELMSTMAPGGGNSERKAGGGEDSDDEQKAGRTLSIAHLQQKCTITCFAPDGSPLQGTSFIVGAEGATIGRKIGSQIPLYMEQSEIPENKENGTAHTPSKIVNLDSAVSSEHARIEMDSSTGKFYILDGTSKKSSTNGTWVRLSGPNQESPYSTLIPGVEVLIGTVRFVISESMTILEKAVPSSVGGTATASTQRLVQSTMKAPKPKFSMDEKL